MLGIHCCWEVFSSPLLVLSQLLQHPSSHCPRFDPALAQDKAPVRGKTPYEAEAPRVVQSEGQPIFFFPCKVLALEKVQNFVLTASVLNGVCGSHSQVCKCGSSLRLPDAPGHVHESAPYLGTKPAHTGVSPDGPSPGGPGDPSCYPLPFLQVYPLCAGHLSTALACSRVGSNQLSRGSPSSGAAPCMGCRRLFKTTPDRAEEKPEKAQA